MATAQKPKVFIIGGGFGGLAAAKALAKAPVEVMVIDRRNYHLFQPLLYQVATAALSPADISAPIRTILRDQLNCEVAMAEVSRVDLNQRCLVFQNGEICCDYLILATGATHAYFGHDEWAAFAPGLKGIEDAIELRRRILLAFESAEYEGSESARRATLTFGIVGAGPTGVELAGAVKEIAGRTLPQDYKHIDTRSTHVILFQGGDRVLPAFPPPLSARAQRDLERLGVEVRLGARVTNVTTEGVYINGQEFVPVHNVFWAAGVRASRLSQSLGVPLDWSGRVIVGPDLTIPGHPQTFVIGDLASAKSADTGLPVPGVAQAAIQMGEYAAHCIAREVAGRGTPATRAPFAYRDRGSLAVIGKARAVAQIGKLNFGGFFAWLLWGGVHIAFLVGFRNRLMVLAHWFWNWLINARDARLITGHYQIAISKPRPPDFVLQQQPPPKPAQADSGQSDGVPVHSES